MNENLNKALKSSKFDIIFVLILYVLVQALFIYSLSLVDSLNSNIFLKYILSTWNTFVFIILLIISFIMYKKEKYNFGGKILLGGTIFQTIFIIMNIISAPTVFSLLSLLIPFVLVIDSIKVIKLSK